MQAMLHGAGDGARFVTTPNSRLAIEHCRLWYACKGLWPNCTAKELAKVLEGNYRTAERYLAGDRTPGGCETIRFMGWLFAKR